MHVSLPPPHPQTLFNKDYTFFSGAVVNNPHSYGVHRFAGAYPPSTYHWANLGSGELKTSHRDAATMYFGKNLVRVCLGCAIQFMTGWGACALRVRHMYDRGLVRVQGTCPLVFFL